MKYAILTLFLLMPFVARASKAVDVRGKQTVAKQHLAVSFGHKTNEKILFEISRFDGAPIYLGAYLIDGRIVSRSVLTAGIYRKFVDQFERIDAPAATTRCAQALIVERSPASEKAICLEGLPPATNKQLSKWWLDSRRILGI